MQNHEFFRELGLDESETAVYLALLEGGRSSIRKIAETTGINRGRVYECLKTLTEAGLVAFTRLGERRKFFAESPRKIRELLTEKKQQIAQAEEHASLLVPQLLARTKRTTEEANVRFYEDDEGVVAILRDVIGTCRQLQPREYRVYSARPIRQYIYRRFPNFTRRRVKEEIFVKALAIGEGGEEPQLSERRWLPAPPEEYLASYVLIYGPKVALISVTSDEIPYGVVVEDPGMAATQTYLFEHHWSLLEA